MNRVGILKEIDFFKSKNFDFLFDALTKVVNKKNTMEFIQYLIEKKTPFSMFLFDIDNFKDINDNYGHPTGDKILAAATERLKERIGDDAILGRFGGDEFILISFKALTYDQMMEYMRYVHYSSRPYENLYNDMSITFTVGGVSFPKDAQTFEDIQELMDKCMYRGKKKGRNCFIIYVKEKHQELIVEKKILTNATLFEDIYHIIMDKNYKIDNLQAYIESNIDIPMVKIINKKDIEEQFTIDNILQEDEYTSFIKEIKKERYLVAKSLNDIYDKYPTLNNNIINRVQAFILYPIVRNGKTNDYLLLIDNERKHMWQDRDICLASYIAKIIGLGNK